MKVAYGREWYIKNVNVFVSNKLAAYTFLTKEKHGSVSDNYDLGTIKYNALTVLS